MFFENDILSFHILDVLELNQKNIDLFNTGRNFNALSFRFRADTHIKTKNFEYHMKDHCVSYFPARVDYHRAAKIDELIVIHFDTIPYHSEHIECFEAKNPEVFAGLFRKILHCWNEKSVGYPYQCAAILYEIFAECYSQNFKPEAQHSKIQKSVDYILKHYRNSKLTIKEIADQSFVSEVYFRKRFKEEYGISPQKYIINLRIQSAMSLISTGYYSLKEVSALSGYSDYKYFSVEFKKIAGVSPSEYFYHFDPP